MWLLTTSGGPIKAIPGFGRRGDDGEVAYWRLDLELSDLGQAFLTLDEFLASEVIRALFNR